MRVENSAWLHHLFTPEIFLFSVAEKSQFLITAWLAFLSSPISKSLQAFIELGFEIIEDFVVWSQDLLQLSSHVLIYDLILGRRVESFRQNIVFSMYLWL